MGSKINYYNMDCMEFMQSIPDNYYDLAIVDPEQGLKQHGGTNRSGYVKQKNGSKIFVKDGGYEKLGWDNRPASPEYFKELFRVSKHQIIWGCQYYHENFGKGRIIWDKCNEGADQSDCEIAFNSLTNRVDLFRYMWRGMMQGKSISEGHIQQGNKKLNEKRFHPTQKPSRLYMWLLKKYAKEGWKIFDSHLGSGSHGIACLRLGFSLDACEVSKSMYNKALSWLHQESEIKNMNPVLQF